MKATKEVTTQITCYLRSYKQVSGARIIASEDPIRTILNVKGVDKYDAK